MSSKRFPSPAICAAILVLALLACNASVPSDTPPPQDTPVSQATATSQKPGSELVTPTGSGLPSNPMGATSVETHIRSGPGTDYPSLAVLAAALPVRLTGRNADKSWLQVEFSASPDGRGWIYAGNVNVNPAVNVDALPVASAPPPPPTVATGTPTATATNTPAPTLANTATATRKPPTYTPVPPTAAPIFRADRLDIGAGECTTLRWDVDNVKAVFLNAGYGWEPAMGHDTRRVCLDATATFKLRVVGVDDKIQDYAITITVSGQCGNTPVIARFDASATQIKPGESVTFVWDVLCAQAVYFKEGSNERQPAGGHDSRTVQPSQTTVYKLIVIARDGNEIRKEITVTVAP